MRYGPLGTAHIEWYKGKGEEAVTRRCVFRGEVLNRREMGVEGSICIFNGP